MENLNFLLNIVKVALGLGFVIFIHELGHFLLAKWNGVKVEKFSIGFGPTVFGWVRGETEYVLAALPLGGFVKMLGEGPEDQENKTTDPRAYPNKSVSARMAIISAGVIMNLFLALGCFTYRYLGERDEVSAVLQALETNGWLAPGALVIVERATRSGPVGWPAGFAPDRARRYGEATFWYAHAPYNLLTEP